MTVLKAINFKKALKVIKLKKVFKVIDFVEAVKFHLIW